MLFLLLIEDIDDYMAHKERDSELYRRLSHFLYSISNCERCENILHELSLLGIDPEDCGEQEDFTDAHSVWHVMLKLGYWKD